MPERGEVDGTRLRRSWEELEADVVARGRQLRRRQRAAHVLPVAVAAAVVMVVAVTLVSVAAMRDEPRELVGAGAPRTRAAPPIDTLPRLAFARFYDGGRDGSAIFVTEAGASNPRRLTPDPAWRDGAPTWSPDGRWIAFDSQRDNRARGVKTILDVYVMRPDGTDVRRVTTTAEPGSGNGSQHPSWSPDGERLAIVTGDRFGVARVVVLRADGSDAHAITGGPGDMFPAWSPDGRWIAFQRGDAEVWLVRPDGTDAHRLASTDRPTRLTWTADGRAVTFADGPQLVSVSVDDGDRTIVSDAVGSQDYDATWVPGGAFVAYSSDPDGLYLVNVEPDGTTTHIGGPTPGTIVLAEPRGPIRRTVTHPKQGDSDVNATFAPG